MNKDLKRETSDWLLKAALEEQLEQELKQKNYRFELDQEYPHEFSKAHQKRMEIIFRMAEKAEKGHRRRRRWRQTKTG